MLDVVRANKKSILSWVIIFGIAIVFAINFGPGSLSKGGAGCGAPAAYAARVNGKTIPAGELERQYSSLVRFYQQQAGEGFTRELAAQLGLPRQAMTALVERELALQDARRRGIVVSDKELSDTVHRMPAFQEGGQFSYDAYLAAVRQNYGSPAKFEDALRDDLLYQKMVAVIGETVKVPEAEVRAQWQSGADKASLAFVRFPLAAAEAEARPSDAEVKAFADREGERIKKAYQERADRYDQKQRVHVRHILARVAAGAPAAEDEAARKKIEAAAARVKAGEPFAKVAGQASEDANTKDKGGDLGFIAEGLADPAFAKAALALKKGQVSEPVRTPSGWHLVLAEEVVPARQVPLDAARLEIARDLLAKEAAGKVAQARAQAALDALRGGRSLAQLFPTEAEAKKARGKPVTLGTAVLAVEETGPFTAGTGFVPKVGAAPELAQAALSAQQGQVLPKVFDTPAGPVVAVVKLRERADPAGFEAQRAAVEARLAGQRAEEVRRSWMATLRAGAKVEENLALLSGPARPQPE
jgi:peptidyl-prolyl cis-trans isomerase D